MTPRILTLSVAILLAAVLLVAACSAGRTKAPSSTSSSTASPTAMQASGPTIAITDFRFASPQAVPPGATVTVTNSDGAEHTVTADSGNAFNVEVDGKGTATLTAPSQPGIYAYHCNYHPMMHGQLIVA
ncbi:cupredoxin domain-containing protein [Mycolicibacterium sp. Dal123E01]|uniref:cupredoxin domain-containing protein n=1 Tax=Mycolicibacterium sp. Dal123E01 TaxID=3457578 RepID=UPI00403E9847